MRSMMRYISRIHRCAGQWRQQQLNLEELNGVSPVYLVHICGSPGISQEMLAKRMMVNKSNVARQLSLLETAGYIERKVSSSDKRVYEVFPTEKARFLFPRIESMLAKWETLLLNELTEEEKQMIQRILPKLAERAKQIAEGEGQ